MKIIKYTLFVTILIVIAGCGSSSNDDSEPTQNNTPTSTTILIWDTDKWNDSNWE